MKEYNSEKKFILYLSKGSGEPDGFVVVGENLTLNEKIANATRMESDDATKVALKYQEITGRYPFKLEIVNYNNFIF